MEREKIPSPEVEQQIVPLESARFTDQLTPESDGVWKEIVATLPNLNMDTADAMTEIWKNPDTPQAFKDRAMLIVYGDYEVREQLGVTQFRGNFSWGIPSYLYLPLPSPQELKSDPMDDRNDQFVTWLRDVENYQDAHDHTLISEPRMLKLWLDLHIHGDISSSDLHTRLDRYDLVGMEVSEIDDTALPEGRFPLVYDMLIAIDQMPDSYTTWASQQLINWFDAKHDPDTQLPRWLADVDDQLALDVIRRLSECQKHGGWNTYNPPKELLEAAGEYFGWNKVIPLYKHEVNHWTENRLSKKYPDISRKALRAHLMSASKINPDELLVYNQHEKILAFVEPLNDKVLNALLRADAEHAHKERQKAEKQQKSFRENIEKEYQQSDEYKQREMAKEQFAGLLQAIQVIDRSDNTQ